MRSGLRRAVRSPVPIAKSICNAPSASLYLDQRGDVRACCQNAGFALGNVTEQSLREIWDGHRARRLRAAVDADDLSLGCNFCMWQVEAGNSEAVFARTFDHLDHGGVDPRWPQQLELSLSNACNLQCEMCNGEWSSAIRAHREKLPPLPVVYDDAFFEDLAEFLPHLKVVKFLGGEPFLGREPLRVMEMLADLGTDIPVHITTNGTQWSPRIERILERLKVYVVISLDGVTPSTYEAIRVGSDLDLVTANLDNFANYSRRRGTTVGLTHCLMTRNWHEFPEFLTFAEERRLSVYVNTVTEPYSMSLYHLAPSELRAVVDSLQRRDAEVRSSVSGRRLEVWDQQLARLGEHLAELEQFRPPSYVAKRRRLRFAWLASPTQAEMAQIEIGKQMRTGEGVGLDCDADGLLQGISASGGADSELVDWVRSVAQKGQQIPEVLEDPNYIDDKSVVDTDFAQYLLAADSSAGPGFEVSVARAASRDRDGLVDGMKLWIARTSEVAGAPPSSAESSARSALISAGEGARSLGLRIDSNGLVAGILEDEGGLVTHLSETLVGASVNDLTVRLGGVLGRPVGELDRIGKLGQVESYEGVLEDFGGERRSIQVFVDDDSGEQNLWLVLSKDQRSVSERHVRDN